MSFMPQLVNFERNGSMWDFGITGEGWMIEFGPRSLLIDNAKHCLYVDGFHKEAMLTEYAVGDKPEMKTQVNWHMGWLGVWREPRTL